MRIAPDYSVALTNRQEEMLTILVQRYDEYGAEDGIFFDTHNSNLKRTLVALEKKGLVRTWIDIDDPTRMWAANIPPVTPED